MASDGDYENALLIWGGKMVWYSVFYLLSFFFRTQWNLHAEENTYCLRIIHNKYLKEGNMLRWKLVEKLVLCVSGEREILWRSGLCRQFEGILHCTREHLLFMHYTWKIKKTNMKYLTEVKFGDVCQEREKYWRWSGLWGQFRGILHRSRGRLLLMLYT